MSPVSAAGSALPVDRSTDERVGVRPPVAFVKYYDKGSTRLGGEQVAAGLNRRGWSAGMVAARELARLRQPSILVFIKTSRLDHLLVARLRGHRLALDVQDTVVFKRRIKNRWLYDALIFKNRRQLADFGRRRRADRVIYHQWDERYRPHQAGIQELRVGYLGEPRSIALWEQLPGVSFHAEDWFAAASHLNCHLSIRSPGREHLYKPSCKIATAAACDAILISTRDVSAVELLGEDYPFYCDWRRESVLAAIERARQALGGALWEQGLRRLREVRERTRMPVVLAEYEQLFAALAPRLRGGRR
jgi:hypothetical protein